MLVLLWFSVGGSFCSDNLITSKQRIDSNVQVKGTKTKPDSSRVLRRGFPRKELMKTIHIYDMDDTLLVTPTFADMMKQGADERLDDFLKNLKQAFLLFMSKEIEFNTMGDFIVLYDVASKKPLPAHYLTIMKDKLEDAGSKMKPEMFSREFGIKRSSLQDIMKAIGEKQGHIIVLQVRGFHANRETIGHILNSEVEMSYRSAENKMIVTGRGESLMFDIARRLKWVGMDYPNYGLYCFPKSGHKSISDFKVRCILDTIREHQWEEVHFYEDRSDWLKSASMAVKSEYPDVVFVEHHIQNVHGSRSM